tara:strand:+ start:2419 stop:2625 length:207 start_codon:yes stop_codon:yes gene_type:complete
MEEVLGLYHFPKAHKKKATYPNNNHQYLKSFTQNGSDPRLFWQHYGFQSLQSSLLELINIFLTIYLCH